MHQMELMNLKPLSKSLSKLIPAEEAKHNQYWILNRADQWSVAVHVDKLK